MKFTSLAVALSAWSVAVAFSFGPTHAHQVTSSLSPSEIAGAIKGKTCFSRAGAKFSFGIDGNYIYDGLWKSSGIYNINWNSIDILFDSGLRRAFSISMTDGKLFIEGTHVACNAVS